MKPAMGDVDVCINITGSLIFEQVTLDYSQITSYTLLINLPISHHSLLSLHSDLLGLRIELGLHGCTALLYTRTVHFSESN
jgi:hypothetical protein